MLRDDYVIKAVQRLAEALARVVGLRSQQRHEEALEVIAAAKGALPLVPGAVDRLSEGQLRRLLDDEQLLRTLADLYRQEAELNYMQGNTERAIWCRRRYEQLAMQSADAQTPNL